MDKKALPSIGMTCQKNLEINILDMGKQEKKVEKRLLLHSCCGPCSTACIERLLGTYKITVFFYNPNITDREEYEKRKANQKKFIEEFNKTVDLKDQVEFIEGEYLPEDYYKVCGQYGDEPEGGIRCTECFKLRMERTAQVASKGGYNIFGTTLTVSPHKNYPLISAIGTEIGKCYKIDFLDIDFKKKAGFQRSIELSKKYELYRQNYCGCEYSNWTLKELKHNEE